MASINNSIRTRNYKLTVAQLESAQSRISDLEGEVSGLQANAEKATGFDLLAEKDGIKNTFAVLDFYSEISKNETVAFDNKADNKVLNVTSIVVKQGKTTGKVIPVLKLAKPECIYNGSGVELCKFEDVEFGEIELNAVTTSGSEWSCGDLTLCQNVAEPSSPVNGTNQFTIDNPYAKLAGKGDEIKAFGDLSVDSAKFTVSCVSSGSGASTKYYVKVSCAASTLVANPIPAKPAAN